MAFLIAFASQTGNCGKTMLATAMAAELAKAGLDVVLIDADKEHRDKGWSASTWTAQRQARHPHRDFYRALDAETTSQTLQLIARHQDADVVIIDCPSRAHLNTVDLAAAMDVTIFPITATPKDTDLTAHTIQQLQQHGIDIRRIGFVYNHVHSAPEFLTERDKLTAKFPATDLTLHPPLFEQGAYTKAIRGFHTITEAQPRSLRDAALATIDSIIGQYRALVALEQPREHAA